jgi:hypothetical protein
VTKTTTSDQVPDQQPKTSWRTRLQGGAVALLVVIGGLGLASFVAIHWIESQVFNTDNWVSLVSPLPKEPTVANALGQTVSDRLFESVAVQQKITEALPPQAAFLAGPLSSQLRGLMTTTAQKAVASDTFQSVWTGANRLAMNRMLAKARGQTPPAQARINEKFNINISQIATDLRQKLGQSAVAIPALQSGAGNKIVISADLKAKQERLHQFVRSTDTLNVILPTLTIMSFLGALAIAKRRRVTALAASVFVIFLMLAELIGVKWLRQTTLGQVKNNGNLPAVSFIFDTVTGGLRNIIFTVLIVMLVALAALWFAGQKAWVAKLRSFVHLDRLQMTRPLALWHTGRQWVRRWEYYLYLGVFLVIIAALGLFTNLITGQTIVNALLLTLGLFALLHLIATPRHHSFLTSVPTAKT